MTARIYSGDCVPGMAEHLEAESVDLVVTSTPCSWCRQAFTPAQYSQKFCSSRCCWTAHNRTRTLAPNVMYDCLVCGQHVERYLSPSRQAAENPRFCSRRCKGKALSGANHPLWRGGRRVNDQGYVLVYMPDHPSADKKGLVREHRLVVEQNIGRLLEPREVVHHVNGNTRDNRLENLQLFRNNAEHKAHDRQFREVDTKGRLLPVHEHRA